MFDATTKVFGSIFLSPKNKILLVKGKSSGIWSFPKGHAKYGETSFQCAKRETFEETGNNLSLFFEKIVNLAKGSYFLYRSEEFDCSIQDQNEVSETQWVSLDNIENYNVNVDVNTFLRDYRNIYMPTTQRRPAIIRPEVLRYNA
jgi:8-oxo-dGTP pyrophosphatase MutT (NUDIX family)